MSAPGPGRSRHAGVGDRMAWPALDYEAWKDTIQTVHLWTQIVGKIRLTCTPWINHSWHSTFYVTPRGLTTGLVPHGDRVFEIDFDFVDHRLVLASADGRVETAGLYERSVADFYAEVMARLVELDLLVRIDAKPNELPDPILFHEDRVHASYDAPRVRDFQRALASSARVLQAFRGDFRGKCSPVHFFWGGFDLAVTRFSGLPAPTHPGGIPHLPDWVTREAYSEEVSSAGFWPGNENHPEAAFYSYAYPGPEGFAGHPVGPDAATWSDGLGEFLLPYEAVRTAEDPDAALSAFLQSTYEAAAELGGWDRTRLEWNEGRPGRPE